MKTLLRLGVLGTSGTLVYPLVFANTEFYYQQTPENEAIMQECATHVRKYRPSVHLPAGAL